MASGLVGFRPLQALARHTCNAGALIPSKTQRLHARPPNPLSPPRAASEARAWPFEEARRLIARLDKLEGGGGQDRHLRDRLRAVGAAAHRHLRRGRAHEHGAPRLRGADRGQAQDAAHLLLRRHGRPAQGARQRAEPGDAARRTRQAADQRARPVRQVRELRPPQQRDAARVPRPLRLRLRVRLGDGGLQGRASSTRRFCACSRPTTR